MEDITEYVEDDVSLQKKTKRLAKWIKQAKHCVVYTGAGISTSAKIPDFRGPQGVWTLKEKGQKAKMEIEMEQAIPTYTHMSLVELFKQDKIKYLVSQNVDGLHRKSGIKANQISELHGNCYIEICDTCNKEFLRNYDVGNHPGKEVKPYDIHCTGRKCEYSNCNGVLRDSIIHFGENLPTGALKTAVEHSEKSDLSIVIGSSLRVRPACKLPKMGQKFGGRLVIINLQKTPYDDETDLRIFAKSDELVIALMKELAIETPSFQIITKHDLQIGNTHRILSENVHKWVLYIKGKDKKIEDSIEWVKVKLHPTFTPSEILLTQKPFELERIGWGVFDIKLQIHFKNSVHEDLNLLHTLSFESNGKCKDLTLNFQEQPNYLSV